MSSTHPVKVAMIGVGDISGIYLYNIITVFKEVELVGICDLIPERAEKGLSYIKELRGEGCSLPLPRIYKDMFEAFNDPEVEVVLNLTRPYEHYGVSKEALLHGKHVYSEKPLGVDMQEARELVALAEKNNLLLGGAPDTFMGAGIQTCRKLIDSGMIGDVIGANCAMVCRGHETWHPDPEFYYKRGGGPMLDMGPYYITALVQLLGEAKGVMGMTKRSFNQRVITSQQRCGDIINVDVDTYLTGSIEFTNGAIAQVCTTFDVYYAPTAQARFEVYGTQGTLVIPDPNTFGGPILLLRPEDAEAHPSSDPGLLAHGLPNPYLGYKQIPLMFDYAQNSRALGLSDMCKALRTGREHRANYKLQRHVLEIMTSFSKSCEEKRYIPLETRYTPTKPMQNNPIHGILD